MQNTAFRSYFKMTPLPKQKSPGFGSYSSPATQTPSSGPVLSQAELNARFQGSSKPQSMFSEAKEGIQDTMKLAGEKMFKSNQEKERQREQDYEVRRQKEIKEEKKLARQMSNRKRHSRKA